MVVDDSGTNLLLLQKLLEDEGYSVIITDDPRKGLEYVDKESHIDLILLDIMMPKIDGFEFMERLSKKQQGEFDIVLHNGKYFVVIEVKYKLHPDDVTDFLTRKLPKFRKLFHEYADKTLLVAVAGMSVPTDSYDLAEKNGLLVLTQSGDNITVMNPEGFDLKWF